MPRAPGQSDFVVYPAARDVEVDVALPESADPVALPKAQLTSNEASRGATRLVMGVMWFLLIALAILCAVGPHIPAGE